MKFTVIFLSKATLTRFLFPCTHANRQLNTAVIKNKNINNLASLTTKKVIFHFLLLFLSYIDGFLVSKGAASVGVRSKQKFGFIKQTS